MNKFKHQFSHIDHSRYFIGIFFFFFLHQLSNTIMSMVLYRNIIVIPEFSTDFFLTSEIWKTNEPACDCMCVIKYIFSNYYQYHYFVIIAYRTMKRRIFFTRLGIWLWKLKIPLKISRNLLVWILFKIFIKTFSALFV